MKTPTLVALLLFSLSVPVFSQVKDNLENCMVTGAVRDFYDLPSPGVEIVLTKDELSIKTITDQYGNYEVLLPEGTYSVELRLHPGTSPYKRALLPLADCKSLTEVYFYPGYVAVSWGDTSKEDEYEDVSTKIGLKDGSVVVRFLESKEDKNQVVFSRAILTHGLFTIKADKVVLDGQKNEIRTEGDVWIESAGKRTVAKTITLKVVSGEIVMESEPKE